MAHFLSTTITLSRLALVIIVFSTLRRVEALKVNATLDPCVDSDDCRLGLLCIAEDGFICQGFTNEVGCRCLSSAPRDCSSAEVECPIAEGCAKSKSSGNTFCVSCNRINEPDTNYTILEGRNDCQITPTPLPTPSKSPGPLGRRLDLCSDIDVCAERSLSCTCGDGPPVDVQTGPCYCFSEGGSCKSTDDCSHPEETCLQSTTDNSTSCGSCTVLKQDPTYVAVDDDGKCDGVPVRSPPVYIPSNGLALDDCESNNQCKSPYKCLNEKSESCKDPEGFLCECNRVKGPFQCSVTSDCLNGEVCAQKRLESSSRCVSMSNYRISAAGTYDLIGQLPKQGKKASFENCQWNPDCQEGLYCTHLSENILGRCYGRKGCSCLPARSMVQCSSADDCLDGEKCAKIPDARQAPMCYSENVLPLDPYFVDISSNSTEPLVNLPKDGWISSLCTNDTDCRQEKFPRVCQHYSEDVPKNMSGRSDLCNGRRMCVCKAKRKSGAECKSSSDCGSGELCIVATDSTEETTAYCESRQVMGLEYFAGSYSILSSDGRKPLPTPSSSPSASAAVSGSPSSSLSPTVSPSTSASSSISVSPSVSPSACSSPSKNQTTTIANPPGESPDSEATSQESEACVAAEALKHMHLSELVYATHRRASVLCDEQGSCATAGHLVEWNGEAMMMRSYCERYSKCVRSVREVNSPRMRMSLRVASRTKGLFFTPLAAKHATRIEEVALQGLVRLGL